MLIPIGHEETSVRRLPWVSFTIMGLCALAWLLSLAASGGEAAVKHRIDAALDYYADHPYLELAEELKVFEYYEMLQTLDTDKVAAPTDPEIIRQEQAKLDRLTEAVADARDTVPEQRWGLTPARFTAYAVITHMFMHAGFLHLLGNMFFFYLVGPYIEDVWGRPLFAAFYLAAGAVAVLGFAWKYPNLEEPLIGASGAVAGTMGAFMIRYSRTKISFFYTLLLRRWTGTFSAPAWLMLSVWLLREVVYAQGGWAFFPGAAGNVAYWAHVFGFVFGVAAALVVKATRFEERFVDKAIERQITVLANPVIDEAMELARAGRSDEAMQRLQAALAQSPDNQELVVALWNVALGCGRHGEVVTGLQPVLRTAARDGELEVIRTFWIDMIRLLPQTRVDTGVAVRVVELLGGADYREETAETIEWLVPRLAADTAMSLLVRLARQADKLHLEEAGRLAGIGLRHPRITPEQAAELRPMIPEASAPSPPAAPPAPTVPQGTAGHAGPTPEIMEAKPVQLGEQLLAMVAGGVQRQLPLNQVRAIAAAVIEEPGVQPFLVIDLLLDDPASRPQRLRIVRLRSTGFSPQQLVGGDDTMTAFCAVLQRLLAGSGARALPDRESVLGRPFGRYRSLAEYQLRILERAAVTS